MRKEKTFLTIRDFSVKKPLHIVTEFPSLEIHKWIIICAGYFGVFLTKQILFKSMILKYLSKDIDRWIDRWTGG